MNENDKTQRMRHIQICRFALIDASLYLDSHPDDEGAAAYYTKYSQLYEKAVSDYEDAYGPITQNSAISNGRWTWNDQPWPWENSR